MASLYNKYRPQKLSDFVGQGSVVDSLFDGLAQGRVSHAYLFAGPRGTGKTTIARLIGKQLNCFSEQKPCGVCSNCQAVAQGTFVDVLELDMASNRGIDAIRHLRDRVEFKPVDSNYRVIILDEVHMLTGEGSNALLKTLEEPPDGVVFILITTKFSKILPTITSRCQIFRFGTLSEEDIFKRLDSISDQEGFFVENEALKLIAHSARGSLRDAISTLDTFSCFENPRLEDVAFLLGRPEYVQIFELVERIAGKRTVEALTFFCGLIDKEGLDLYNLIEEFLNWLKMVLYRQKGITVCHPFIKKIEKQATTISSNDVRTMLNIFNIGLYNAYDLRISFEAGILDCCESLGSQEDF